MPNAFAQAWATEISKDLAGFADRGKEPTVDIDGNLLRARWVVRGRTRDEVFTVSEDHAPILIGSSDSPDISYDEFLTHESMADFAQLAAAIRDIELGRDDFVPTTAKVDGSVPFTERLADAGVLSELAQTATAAAEGTTTLFFLKGAPGAGKTTLLRQATAKQAELFLQGEADFLLFYVSAQGRELSNLRDAFSGELQDLRAAFTRDAIGTLARRGLLIPVIDGFDELLGTAGYSGAFSSLHNLLVSMEGRGAVIVSARSAFYDLEFQGRSSGDLGTADISTTTVDLQPWSKEQLGSYLAQHDLEDPSIVAELSDHDRQLLRRPFFASQFHAYVARDPESQSHSLLRYLMHSYIVREAGKIVDSAGEPVLSPDGHERIFELAAGEMWESEQRSLRLGDLQAVTDMVADEFDLSGDDAKQLALKVTSYAGFRPNINGGADQFAFEHEVYFDYFLGRAIRRMRADDAWSELDQTMDRGVIPQAVFSVAMHADEDGTLEEKLLNAPSGAKYENRRRNYGTAICEAASQGAPLRGIVVRGAAFVDLDMGHARFTEVTFDDVDFVTVDLAGAQFEACDASNASLQAINLSNATRLGMAGLRPGRNITYLRHESAGDLYAPDAIRETIERLGAPVQASEPATIEYSRRAAVQIQLLQRLARAYRHTNLLFEDNEQQQKLFRNEFWPDLRKMLLQTGVVTAETRAVSGPKASVLRLQVPVSDLLAGDSRADVHPAVANLWELLRDL